MKKSEANLNFSRWIINLSVIFVICGGALFAWQTVAKLQTGEKTKTNETTEKPVAVQASGRGNPFVNFTDGFDLTVPNESQNNSQPKNLASADFNSDGVADFVSADIFGNLRFYRGAFLRRDDEEKGRNGEKEQSFELSDKNFALNISPDFLFAGDFNADGKQDVLAAAKNSRGLVLLVGDGQGNFSAPNAVAIDGNISAVETGEIGRKDGQTDVVVAFSNSKGAFLAVFEHPESAFKHKPEIFKLSAPANEIAIGNLDEDFYADIAVASGNILTIIGGRGQAYPWDLIPQLGIQRPKAFVATKQMPFQISAMTVGRFGAKRGETLAILGADGNIYRLEPNRAEKPSNNKLKPEMLSTAKRNLFLPTNAETRNLAILSEPQISAEEAEKQGLLVDPSEIKSGNFLEFQQKKLAEKYKNLSKEELNRFYAEGMQKKGEYTERAKQGFLRSLSGKPSTLPAWTIETIVSDSTLASAANSNASNKMLKVNVSSSNLDDILLVDSIANKIQLVSQPNTEDQKPKTEIANLEVESGVKAVLPMRLNADALSDLVVLRENPSVPSIVMTAPMNVFLVTSDNEDGDCQGANLCSLRNAILLANQTPGVDQINFAVGSATIAPTSQLPVITESVTIFGGTNGNGQPFVEISGTNLNGQGADGFKIRTSNVGIYNLAVNQFPSVIDGNGSQIGGNGITIESTLGSPNNGNNTVQGCFLGTDKTGSLDKGNDATGLNIFDADENIIGGTTSEARNVISGNGTAQKRGVGISMTAGNDNIFHGNIIGLNSLGTGKIGNSDGLRFSGSNNQFGGDGAGEGNTVSGNGEQNGVPDETYCNGVGIFIESVVNIETGELLGFDNTLRGNRFGTNPAGTVGLGNCWRGIRTSPVTRTFIGSITESGRNVISDNGYDAVWCREFFFGGFISEGGYCAISGNNIGTDVTGNFAIPNDVRNRVPGPYLFSALVDIENNLSFSNFGSSGGTTSNGACTGFCNLVSGNGEYYTVVRRGFGTVGIFSNFVGTNKSGTQRLANGDGISTSSIFGNTFIGFGASGNSFGNMVSGNDGTGISAGGIFSTEIIQANLVGTDTSGTFAIPGVNPGVRNNGISTVPGIGGQVLIGSTDPASRNVVAGNANDGIYLNVSSGQTKIVNTLIGLNRSLQPLGNGWNGITTWFANAQIGDGTDEGANQIAHNGWNNTNGGVFAGVLIQPNTQSITIRNNSIYDNNGLGIDLNVSGQFGDGDGVTENDCQDADPGANGLQNYPDLFTPVFNGNGTVFIEGVLRSTPRETFTLDFYASPNADPTNYGEGAAHIGSRTVTTLSNGNITFDFESPEPVPSNYKITATATDENGNTSEFSCAAGECVSLNGKTVEEVIEELGIVCLSPIVVNTTTDDEDLDGDNPNPETRDGFCDTDGDTPDQQCSLRAAIQEANARFGINTINFEIPGAGVQTITPKTALPVITFGVRINGSSQDNYGGAHTIKIDGSNTSGETGLKLAASFSKIEGLTIVGFEKGISTTGANNRIENCYIGINADGTTAPANRQQAGIEIDGGTSNFIGSNSDGDANVISNNVVGISIVGNSSNNRVNNNVIGLDATQSSPLPNDTGIVVDDSDGNLIGTDSFFPNSIAGNNFNGIVLQNAAQSNRISSNKIGSGANVFGNGANGVLIQTQANRNFIGGNNQQDGNTIVGHNSTGAAGVLIADTAFSENYVLNNYIGITDSSGGIAPNYYGVRVGGVGQFIGNNAGGGFAGNHISGNSHSGVLVEDSNNFVIGNFIGTNGTDDLGNGEHGILVTFADGTKIKNNVISGNDGSGIYLNHSGQSLITENKIGTNQNADAAIPNALQGIYVKGDENQIGDNNANEPNIISGNGQNGIYVETFSYSNRIFKNYVGVTAVVNGAQNALGNAENGLRLYGYQTKVKGNIISDNDVGILVQRGAQDPEETNNQIEENLIGTDVTGNLSFGNRDGGIILTNNTSQNIIGPRNIISGNGRNGIHIFSQSHNNRVAINIIGLTQDGSASNGNTDYGVFVEGYVNTVSQNVISGNGTGVRISRTPNSLGATAAANNEFWGNKIGTNFDGTAAIGNTRSGIELTGGAVNNLIGGNLTTGNLVSGNGDGNGTNGRGIYIFTANTDDFDQTTDTPSANRVLGNYVGSNAAHDAAIPNQRTGILIFQSPDNIIGNNDSPTAGSGNVVVGNGIAGIAVLGENATGNRIDYNYVGVTREGVAIGNNPDGININGAPQTLIGNNNICGNSGSGIAVTNVQSSPIAGLSPGLGGLLTKISGNVVGILRDANGNSILIPNGVGIKLQNASGVLIGDTAGGSTKNIFSGNTEAGVLIDDIASIFNQINNSIIGTDGNGASGLGNGVGIKIRGAKQTTIGDAENLLKNVIKLNQQSGIRIEGSSAERNRIINNLIEQNGSDGVSITNGAKINEVGGTAENSGNTITGNGGAGVRIDESAGHCNLVDPNSIFGNTGLGIDLGTFGHTPNDALDADTGANNLQNYPEITSQTINANGDLIVSYKIDSFPGNSNYGTQGLYVEFFKADFRGQGETFLNFDYYTETDYNSLAPGVKQINLGNAAVLGFGVNDKVTATTTDADGNTSEFFPPVFAPTAANVSVSGKVLTANGIGISRVAVSLINPAGETRTILTNSFGNYRFDEVPVGQTYVLTVAHKEYQFANSSRILLVNEAVEGVDFNASP